jgi:ABC-2 type transport system ATP-binding protein
MQPGSGAASTPLLAVRDLVVRRGVREVLRGISFQAGRGEILGFLGPNGAGKSTLFRVLTGLLAPCSGAIDFDGRAVASFDAAFRRRIGVVFQDPALDPRLTARENLACAARLYGVPRREAATRVDELLLTADLRDRASEPVSRLSGGMRRRVELIRALVHDPDLLILDEPTSGLDQRAYRGMWERLGTLRSRRGTTLILNTHDPDEAARCDRLAILDGGRIVACDTPQRLRERVKGDLVVLETDDPAAVAASLSARFGVEARSLDGKVVLEHERAHELIPRIVEALPDRTLRSVGLRRVGMGEVFLELTGKELRDEAAATAPEAA